MVQRILIITNDPDNVETLTALLTPKHEACTADGSADVLRVATEESPDLILIDVPRPELDSITARLRGESRTTDIPIIVITENSMTGDTFKGFDLGGVDYIAKPFSADELDVRIKTHLELKKLLEDLNAYVQRVMDLNDELELKDIQLNEAIRNLHDAAMTDPLTGLGNRRYMMEKFREEIERCRNGGTFSVVLADVDHFKAINDTFGHEFGDYVLKNVAELLKTGARHGDFLSRWGGEEFLFLLPETDLAAAVAIGEKLRVLVADSIVHHQGQPITMTMTFGASIYDQSGTMDATITAADTALYIGKERGRNCVVSL